MQRYIGCKTWSVDRSTSIIMQEMIQFSSGGQSERQRDKQPPMSQHTNKLIWRREVSKTWTRFGFNSDFTTYSPTTTDATISLNLLQTHFIATRS
jgi:hypothetical protein